MISDITNVCYSRNTSFWRSPHTCRACWTNKKRSFWIVEMGESRKLLFEKRTHLTWNAIHFTVIWNERIKPLVISIWSELNFGANCSDNHSYCAHFFWMKAFNFFIELRKVCTYFYDNHLKSHYGSIFKHSAEFVNIFGQLFYNRSLLFGTPQFGRS